MKIKKYRKKPLVVEAIKMEYSLYGQHSVYKWIKSEGGISAMTNTGVDIETQEGTLRANFGDYIIKGIKGEFYPCKADIFEASYESVDN